MPVHVVEPWTDARWDAYAASHPRATVYHSSAWIRIVCEIGRYPALCAIHERDGRVSGVLPLAAVESRLTGRRVCTLPFSDVCFALADDADAARALIAHARSVRASRAAAYYEMRGAPALRDGTEGPLEGFARQGHFSTYSIPLHGDADAVFATFGKKSVRYTISKAERLGVTVRTGDASDLDTFYRLYVQTRRRHGVPPQPRRLFELVMERLRGEARAVLYLAEHEGRSIAAAIVFRYRGTTYLKYEVVDESRRHLAPIHPLLWRTIADAVAAGDRAYDFGRTAVDNAGLNEFKQRWGTVRVELPYYFDPSAEGLSVVKSASLKYRLFTATFRRMPAALSVPIGERIFRHFG